VINELNVLSRNNIECEYNQKSIYIAMGFSVCSGLISSTMGMAGGVLLINVMLRFKLHPQVLSATSTFRSNITSLASGFQFIFVGSVDWN